MLIVCISKVIIGHGKKICFNFKYKVWVINWRSSGPALFANAPCRRLSLPWPRRRRTRLGLEFQILGSLHPQPRLSSSFCSHGRRRPHLPPHRRGVGSIRTRNFLSLAGKQTLACLEELSVTLCITGSFICCVASNPNTYFWDGIPVRCEFVCCVQQ